MLKNPGLFLQAGKKKPGAHCGEVYRKRKGIVYGFLGGKKKKGKIPTPQKEKKKALVLRGKRQGPTQKKKKKKVTQ
ncbi:hypothetical protein, partial [Escherichia coli]|uniref:hypothetical protein n=1 Tax=Escherichia coli TaxID=562 RepID=UPI001161A5A0